jgi:hypothetical protein
MSNEIPFTNDRRGILFTINRETEPLYQLESGAWASPENRWPEGDIPPEIREKVAALRQSGKPGTFVQFLQGEVGVYVICEGNIKYLPEAADDDLVVDGPWSTGTRARGLAPYDLVICAKGGAVMAEGAARLETRDGDYYVVRCQTWSRFVAHPPVRPRFVDTTKDVLLLLENLHRKNFLSMSPDPEDEGLPANLMPPMAVPEGINCYVLNLSRFKR